MTQPGSSRTIFITGTGTGIGKTIVSAIITEALHADYWKPVQAGTEEQTDSEWVASVVSNSQTRVHPEVYRLHMPASPNIAAHNDGVSISINKIVSSVPSTQNTLVIEGAGGLMVPLNDNEFIADLIVRLGSPVILVSRNQLGSINHSLLTAMACVQKDIKVLGWIFNDDYLDYRGDIVRWSGIPEIASIPYHENVDRNFVSVQASLIREQITAVL